jgi:hypothetical protein
MNKLFTITGYLDEVFTQVEHPLLCWTGALVFKSTSRLLTVSMTPKKADETTREVTRILTSEGWFHVDRMEGDKVYVKGDENNEGFFFKFQIEEYA